MLLYVSQRLCSIYFLSGHRRKIFRACVEKYIEVLRFIDSGVEEIDTFFLHTDYLRQEMLCTCEYISRSYI